MFGLASEFCKLSDDDRKFLIERAFEVQAPNQTMIVSVTAHSWEVAVTVGQRTATSRSTRQGLVGGSEEERSSTTEEV